MSLLCRFLCGPRVLPRKPAHGAQLTLKGMLMATAVIKGTVPVPAAGVTTKIKVTETGPDGTVLSTASYDVVAPNSEFGFTAAVGSTLTAETANFKGAFSSGPAFTPPFLVEDPRPGAPTAAVFSVESVTE